MTDKLKVIIVGYDKMLAALANGVTISGNDVVGILRTDRVKYSPLTLFFKDIFAPSRDFSYIKSYNLYDIKARSINSKEFINEFKRLGADLILVGSWGEKFSDEILNLPKYGCINCHPSLLPKHRGANPYFWAIYNGDTKTGVTFHQMNSSYDKGDILFQASINITPDMTFGDLRIKCAKVAQFMVIDLLEDLKLNKIVPTIQDESEATSEPSLTFENLVIDTKRSNAEIKRHLNALSPYMDAYFYADDEIFKIKNYRLMDNVEFIKNFSAGDIIKKEENKFFIKTSDGAVEFWF